MIARLMHEISKRKGKETQEDDVAVMLRQDKGDNPSWRKDIKRCYNCGKPRHIVHFYYKQRTTIKIMSTIPKKMLITHLQCNVEHILRRCISKL